MYKNKKILGVITARGGSKGIPRKNIKLLDGKPLIAYTIEAAAQSRWLSRTIVSTDDFEIAEISKSFGADVPFLRPENLAEDKSTSIQVIQHALHWLKENENAEYDYVMILQPTSPFRTAEDIDACIEKIIETGADSVMSMVELVDFSVKKIKRIEDDVIVSVFEEEGNQSSFRNDGEKLYKRNGAVYLTKVEVLLKDDLFGTVSRPYGMPLERSLDINEPYDFFLAECYFQKMKQEHITNKS